MIKDFGNIATKLARNPIGIIALVFVLVYGIAGFVTSSNVIQPSERYILVWFIVTFPVFLVVIFYLLVTRHHNKLYAPSDYSNEDNFLKTIELKKEEIQRLAEVLIKISCVLADGSGRYGGFPPEHLEKIKDYQNIIRNYLPDNIEKEIDDTIRNINQLIEKRVKEKVKNG